MLSIKVKVRHLGVWSNPSHHLIIRCVSPHSLRPVVPSFWILQVGPLLFYFVFRMLVHFHSTSTSATMSPIISTLSSPVLLPLSSRVSSSPSKTRWVMWWRCLPVRHDACLPTRLFESCFASYLPHHRQRKTSALQVHSHIYVVKDGFVFQLISAYVQEH